jgi:hypothetical protein
MALTIAQAIIFISYVSFLMIKFKGPIPSISDSWYLLKGRQKFLFTLFCFSIGILMLFQSVPSALFFLSGSALSFVGINTTFKDSWITPYVHFAGAGLCIGFALLGIGFVLNSWLPLIGFVISAVSIGLAKIKNETWWIEIAAFIFIILGLLF